MSVSSTLLGDLSPMFGDASHMPHHLELELRAQADIYKPVATMSVSSTLLGDLSPMFRGTSPMPHQLELELSAQADVRKPDDVSFKPVSGLHQEVGPQNEDTKMITPIEKDDWPLGACNYYKPAIPVTFVYERSSTLSNCRRCIKLKCGTNCCVICRHSFRMYATMDQNLFSNPSEPRMDAEIFVKECVTGLNGLKRKQMNTTITDGSETEEPLGKMARRRDVMVCSDPRTNTLQ